MIKTALNAAKTAKGWTNQKLSEESGIALSTVTNTLNETSKTENPRLDTVVPMCRALGVSIDEAVGLKTAAQPLSTAGEAAAYYDAAKKYLIALVEHERKEKEAERAERIKAQEAASKYSKVLTIVLTAVVVVLIIDLASRHIGWFQW